MYKIYKNKVREVGSFFLLKTNTDNNFVVY